MALNQLPVIESTIQIVHSGPTDGATFTATLDASDGAPMADQKIYTFDLATFAPDLVGLFPTVEVSRDTTGEKVEVDIKVTSSTITITFWAPVTPDDYRVKVMG